MVLLVNYNDPEWITTFITEVLTEEDFLTFVRSKNFREELVKKMGYIRVGDSYVYHDGDGDIKEDYNLDKLITTIEDNSLFTQRYIEAVRKGL
jgi:hypothetical protein